MASEDEVSFRFLADNSVDIICRAGVDMVLHYVSPSSFRVLGWKPEEMVGRRPDAFFLPEDVSVLARSFSSDIDDSPVTVRMRMKDGMMAWVEIKHRMVCDSTTGMPRETVIVIRDITERKALQDRLSVLELTDAQTGLSTPRAFDEALEREWNRALRNRSHLSLLLLDFNHFTQFHDWRKHLLGDRCLAKAAAAVIATLRVTDLAARYGAEEIVIMLPSTSPGAAAKVAAKMRSAIDPLRSPHNEKPEGSGIVSVSIGIATALACVGASPKVPEILLLAADRALHKAMDQEMESQRQAVPPKFRRDCSLEYQQNRASAPEDSASL